MSAKAKKPEIESLTDWRQVPQLLTWATKTFGSPEWKLLRNIMQESEHVRLFEDNPPIDPNRKLGRSEGWDLFLSRLRLASQPLELQGPMPEATFAPPDPIEKE